MSHTHHHGTTNTVASWHAGALWAFLAVMTIVDVVSLHVSGLSAAPAPLLKTAAQAGGMLAVAFIYTSLRPDARIASLAHAAAAFVASVAILAIFSYTTVSWHRPLIDEALAAFDHATGLSWVLFYTWVTAHPLLYKVLYVAYASLLPQMMALLVLLNYAGQTRRCWEMIWMFIAGCAGCILVSMFWPAVGAFGHFNIEASRGYVRTFMGFYDGTMTVIGKDPIEGLVQFPSLHAALAVIYTWSARGLGRAFPVFLILNILLFISTAPIGGHHFADLWGGAVLALGAILIVMSKK